MLKAAQKNHLKMTKKVRIIEILLRLLEQGTSMQYISEILRYKITLTDVF